MAQLIEDCLSPDPEGRPSAAEVATRLAAMQPPGRSGSQSFARLSTPQASATEPLYASAGSAGAADVQGASRVGAANVVAAAGQSAVHDGEICGCLHAWSFDSHALIRREAIASGSGQRLWHCARLRLAGFFAHKRLCLQHAVASADTVTAAAALLAAKHPEPSRSASSGRHAPAEPSAGSQRQRSSASWPQEQGPNPFAAASDDAVALVAPSLGRIRVEGGSQPSADEKWGTLPDVEEQAAADPVHNMYSRFSE